MQQVFGLVHFAGTSCRTIQGDDRLVGKGKAAAVSPGEGLGRAWCGGVKRREGTAAAFEAMLQGCGAVETAQELAGKG